ncbi:Uncharacterised protein [Mycobacteroides abscessus subsp. abscessus]|nr:Uncharacterised protein [Mycobacteroides abscessus subsp. abscessus]
MHQQRGLGCDDAYAYGVTDGFVIAAVADGAGSVSGTSAWGSHAATQSVLTDALRRRFRRAFHAEPASHAAQMRWLFERALTTVRAQAAAMKLDVPLLSTTLSVVVADRRRAVFGQIGDGVIAAETSGGISTFLTETKDDYANTTWFLQSDRAFEESFRTATVLDMSAFALSTDGMTYKITNIATGEPYEPFFRGSWQHVRSGTDSAHFAALMRGIKDDQTGDDKTMVLAALRWEADDFHPSDRPVQTLMVSSAAPRSGSRPVPAGGDTARRMPTRR